MQNLTFLGIDTGGTFTDFVCFEQATNSWRTHKVLSTPSEPETAILKGIQDLGLLEQVKQGDVTLIHGTTVATNAALEGRGASTAYITNTGLKDVLRIGRQTRSELYNLTPPKLGVPVNPDLLFEIAIRQDSSGTTIESADSSALDELKAQIDAAKPDAIAINLLFSFLDPKHEIELEKLFADDYFVSRSSEVLPEYREFERGATTWVNSWLGPRIETYLKALQVKLAPAPIAIMQSSGLTIAASLAAKKAVNLLLSGPAGGLSAAQYISRHVDRDRLMTFDMGGTSTDVALINGEIGLTNQGTIAGIPIGVPMADIHTIGAGGGSIAYVDQGGLLQVGPESAGADPGPACYGKGGRRPTVTDANLILGKLDSAAKLAGNLTLDLVAAESAVKGVADQLGQSVIETAQGIIAIANEHMTQALRVISIQRGFDPRTFTLVCFGGAGGLHVCDLADALEMTEILIPMNGGVLSALGMLTTQPGRELVKTLQVLTSNTESTQLRSFLDDLAAGGERELHSQGVTSLSRKDSLDLRYEGQTHTLNIKFNSNIEDAIEVFHTTHKTQFGHTLAREVEILNCRVHLEATSDLPPLMKLETQSQAAHDNVDGRDNASSSKSTGENLLKRSTLNQGDSGRGPCLILDNHSTLSITDNWQFTVDEYGNIVLSRR